jgi:hypothetical protein
MVGYSYLGITSGLLVIRQLSGGDREWGNRGRCVTCGFCRMGVTGHWLQFLILSTLSLWRMSEADSEQL